MWVFHQIKLNLTAISCKSYSIVLSLKCKKIVVGVRSVLFFYFFFPVVCQCDRRSHTSKLIVNFLFIFIFPKTYTASI